MKIVPRFSIEVKKIKITQMGIFYLFMKACECDYTYVGCIFAEKCVNKG
jgi:hypothetical protein